MVKQLINVIIAGTVVVIMYNFLSHQDILIGDMLQKESVKGAYLTGAGFLDVNIKLWIYRIISIVIIIAVYNFIKGIKKEESKKILFSIILIPAALIIVFIVNIAIDSIFLRGNDIDREKELPKLPNNSISIIVAILLGLAAQYYLAGQILSVINMGFFGKKDSIFHMDYSYFIMAIPVIQTILKMILVFLAILSLYIVRILYNSY